MPVHRGIARDRDRHCEHDGMRQITMNSQFLPLRVRTRPGLGDSPETAATVADVRRGRQPYGHPHRAPEQPRSAGFAKLDPNTRFRVERTSPANCSSGGQALTDAAQKADHKAVEGRTSPLLAVRIN